MRMHNPPPFPMKMVAISVHHALIQWNHPAFRNLLAPAAKVNP